MRLAGLLTAALLVTAPLVAAPLVAAASADPTNGCAATAPGSLQCSYDTQTGTVQLTYAGTGGWWAGFYRDGNQVGAYDNNAVDALVVSAHTFTLQPGDQIRVVAYAGIGGTFSRVDVRDL